MPPSTDEDVEKNTSVYDFVVLDAKKKEYPLAQHRGSPLLIGNIAMKCGFTQQGMEMATHLHKKYSELGFCVLGFPSNEFKNQNPQDEEETVNEACSRFKADFPIMKKITVNDQKADPLFKWLKKNKPGILGTESIKWNFTFFLIDKEGKPVYRFAPGAKTEDVEKRLLKVYNDEVLDASFASNPRRSSLAPSEPTRDSLAGAEGEETLLDKSGEGDLNAQQPKEKEKTCCCC